MSHPRIIAKVEKVERPRDRYVPYVDLSLRHVGEGGHIENKGDVSMSELTFSGLAGCDPIVGDEYEIQLVPFREG